MSGKNPRLKPLQSRKQLLLAESELNRAQMIRDMAALTAEIHALGSRARSFGSIASSAVVLATGLAAFRRGTAADADAKPSWVRTVLKGAGLVSNLWLVFRPKSRNRNGD
jgi:hypothetical protein